MRCFECRYLDRSKVLTCYPPKYYCIYDKTAHFADDECKSEHYPIVRCKDCKWYGHVGCAIKIVDDSDAPQDNDYCSFGERKGGEKERMIKAEWTNKDSLDLQPTTCNQLATIESLSTEAVQGEWHEDSKGYFYCDQCHKYPKYQEAKSDFCPSCGARMYKGGEE